MSVKDKGSCSNCPQQQKQIHELQAKVASLEKQLQDHYLKNNQSKAEQWKNYYWTLKDKITNNPLKFILKEIIADKELANKQHFYTFEEAEKNQLIKKLQQELLTWRENKKDKQLFLDIGTSTSAWKFKDREKNKATRGKLKATNPSSMTEQIIKVIKDHNINYLITERWIEERLPSENNQDLKEKFQILKAVINYCRSNNIEGFAIKPWGEVEEQRKKQNYCWKQNWREDNYCDVHGHYPFEPVKILDEVDTDCFEDIANNLSPEQIKLREAIFGLPIEIKLANYSNFETKTERLNSYREKQNNYANQ